MIEEAGIEPREVPENIWVPLLQAASLETDDSLQERWASLLANASKTDSQVLPSFLDILKQLTGVPPPFLGPHWREVYLLAGSRSVSGDVFELTTV